MGSTYIELPVKLKNPIKDLVNIKRIVTINVLYGVILDI